MASRLPALSLLPWIIACVAAGCGDGRQPFLAEGAGTVLVSAAASLSEALREVADGFERQDAARVVLNFGSSGILAQQIASGARVDLFLSADEAQMDRVAAAGRIKPGTRVDLLSNQLVVMAAPGVGPLASPRDLLGDTIRRVAIGDPATVPAGLYARRYLEAEGVWDALQSRILPAASVRATLAAVDAGDAEAALVYRTDVAVATRARLAFAVPLDRGPRIVYPAAVVAGGNEEAAARLLAHLSSSGARAIFARHGFIPLPA
jgi:molybdate transport system substrate-binding protein